MQKPQKKLEVFLKSSLSEAEAKDACEQIKKVPGVLKVDFKKAVKVAYVQHSTLYPLVADDVRKLNGVHSVNALRGI